MLHLSAINTSKNHYEHYSEIHLQELLRTAMQPSPVT
jgi:hypothetical protein